MESMFRSLELKQFPIITFEEIELARIESIRNQFISNFLVWVSTELISRN
jgi:hypothetical protein